MKPQSKNLGFSQDPRTTRTLYGVESTQVYLLTQLWQGCPCWYTVQKRVSPVLPLYLFCVHSPGFAKKTFISYSVTFKDNFRQGQVVGIDLKNQTVQLQDGEVSTGG
jgi:hypothetical protein